MGVTVEIMVALSSKETLRADDDGDENGDAVDEKLIVLVGDCDL